MIAAGNYDHRNSHITAENFPITGNGQVTTEIVLVHFNRDIESDDAVKEQEQMGLRPATLPELLAFGAKYPDVQREFPIVALGSSWVDPFGDRHVPSLDRWDDERELYLDYYDDGWDGDCRFLAVRS